MSRIFVTGFGPFLDVKDNPSEKLARASGCDFEILPVSYRVADDFLARFPKGEFDVLLMIGVAGNRKRMSLERFGRNCCGAALDVDGISRSGPIQEGGPDLVETTLWTSKLITRAAEIQAVRSSETAGSYLCNYLAYRAPLAFPRKRVGFLHVPSEDRIPINHQRQIVEELIELIRQS